MRRRPGIPAIDPKTVPAIAQVLQPLKEHAEIAMGLGSGPQAYLRRSVTLGMLVKLGIISTTQAKSVADDE